MTVQGGGGVGGGGGGGGVGGGGRRRRCGAAAALEEDRSTRSSWRDRLGRRLDATAGSGAAGLDQHVVVVGFVPART